MATDRNATSLFAHTGHDPCCCVIDIFGVFCVAGVFVCFRDYIQCYNQRLWEREKYPKLFRGTLHVM